MNKVFYTTFLFMMCLIGCSSLSEANKFEDDNQICFENICFEVEIAKTSAQWQRGLQFRESLDAEKGMLFIFPQSAQHAFWMKDTHIALDMIWMDQSRRIIHIEQSVPPCIANPCVAYGPEGKALYVLEINAGLSKKFGLRLGDEAFFVIE